MLRQYHWWLPRNLEIGFYTLDLINSEEYSLKYRTKPVKSHKRSNVSRLDSSYREILEQMTQRKQKKTGVMAGIKKGSWPLKEARINAQINSRSTGNGEGLEVADNSL
jgi:hypothetical protein